MFKAGDKAIVNNNFSKRYGEEVSIIKVENKVIRYGGCVDNRGEVYYQKAYPVVTIKFNDGTICTLNPGSYLKKKE